MGFPGGSDGKESACNAEDSGLIPRLGRSPGERDWQPTPVFLPGESHEQRSLVGCNPQGHKESDMTKQLTLLNYDLRYTHVDKHSCNSNSIFVPTRTMWVHIIKTAGGMIIKSKK